VVRIATVEDDVTLLQPKVALLKEWKVFGDLVNSS
jgi:hypothetical protein